MERNKIFIWLFVFVYLGSLTSPLEAQEAEAGKEEEPKLAEAPKTTAPGNVTMDFKNADVHNVLRILSYKSGVNIVAGPEVTGMITIRLTDVPWERALDIILRTYGFAYEREGNIIRVTTIEGLKQEELTTEVYSLNYAKAEEVTESVKEMLTDRGRIKFDERTNVAIVTDIPTSLYQISRIIHRLDKRTPQVLIEAKIVETRLDDSERLGIDWSTKIIASGAQKPTTFPFTRRVQTDVERGMDRYFPIGSTTSPTGGQQYAGTTETEFPAGEIVKEKAIFPFVETEQFSFGTLDFTQFKAVLEFLEQRTDTDILSNPRITTLNNKEASILVGKKMLFPSFSFNEETGDFIITGFEDEKDVGVKLVVTPHVNAEGDITIELEPEIKDFVGIQTLDASRGIVAPIFTTREAQAEVMIRDGDTIMMGGLITKNTENKDNKVPFLGDIPLVGDYFFTKKEKTIERKELIIFITVHLVKEKWATHLDPSTAYVPMPVPKDTEVFMALPETGKKREKKWWEFW